jgi:hypothetical protein
MVHHQVCHALPDTMLFQKPATRCQCVCLTLCNCVRLAVQLSDVVQLIYGPYTENLRRKPASERVDPVWCCFSMEMRSGERTVRFLGTTKHHLCNTLSQPSHPPVTT